LRDGTYLRIQKEITMKWWKYPPWVQRHADMHRDGESGIIEEEIERAQEEPTPAPCDFSPTVENANALLAGKTPQQNRRQLALADSGAHRDTQSGSHVHDTSGLVQDKAPAVACVT
jgi:hypothetical protein